MKTENRGWLDCFVFFRSSTHYNELIIGIDLEMITHEQNYNNWARIHEFDQWANRLKWRTLTHGSDSILLKFPFLIILYPGSRGRFSKYSHAQTYLEKWALPWLVSVKIKLLKALATNYNWLLLSPTKKKSNVEVRQDHFWPRLSNIDRGGVRWRGHSDTKSAG